MVIALNDTLAHLHGGQLEQSLDWSRFGNHRLADNLLTVVRSWGLLRETDLHLELPRNPKLNPLGGRTFTVSKLRLHSFREEVAAGVRLVDGFQKRVLMLNEKYDWAIDQLSEGETIPLARGDALYKLLHGGFQIFTNHHIGFVLSANYDALAVCPSDDFEFDLHDLRERTFDFLSDPALTGVLNCEEFLQPRRKSS